MTRKTYNKEPTANLNVRIPKRMKDILSRNASSERTISTMVKQAIEAFVIQQNLDAMTEDQRNCDGWNRSNCCGAYGLDRDTGLCFECHDHAETECADCEDYQGCENFQTVN